ncbi:uncharacterized protein BXZ73DRAFT_101152 [Epithele typhae]|uniref:uncharacterized protein n=1 Tax=Epithele typhae TaxID=378194 RepID=UPI002008A91B|nr:uncharacterized protein BXZ73DRAFT_101152 [Epithele typhae]KAH9933189.1 hypothetical protein BXZ73DRAFT_101152 [Epithele typhae]
MFASSPCNVRRFRKAFNLAPFQALVGDDRRAHGMDVDIPSTPSTPKASVRTSDVANESMPGPSVGGREKLMAQRRRRGVVEPHTPERKRGALQPPSAPRKRRLPKGTLWDLPDFKVCSLTATHPTALTLCINAFFTSVTPKPTVRKFDLMDAAAASPNVDDSEEPMTKRRRWGAGEPCTPKLKSLVVQTPPAPKKRVRHQGPAVKQRKQFIAATKDRIIIDSPYAAAAFPFSFAFPTALVGVADQEPNLGSLPSPMEVDAPQAPAVVEALESSPSVVMQDVLPSIDQLIPRFIRKSVARRQRRLQVKAYGPRPQRQALPRDAPSVAYDKAKRPHVHRVPAREAEKPTVLEQQQFYEAMASLKANLNLTETAQDDAMDNMELDHEVEIMDDEYMAVDDEDVEMASTDQTTDADDDVQPMEDQRQDISASLPYAEVYRNCTEGRTPAVPLPPAPTLPSPTVIETVMDVKSPQATVAVEQPRTTVVDEELQSMIVFKEPQAVLIGVEESKALPETKSSTISLPPSLVLHTQGILSLE